MAKHVLQRIVQGDRDEQPFDAEWMTTVFEEYWEKDAQYACAFTNALLEPITPSVAAVLAAGATSSAIAGEFFSHMNNPREYWPWLVDPKEAEKWVAERTTS